MTKYRNVLQLKTDLDKKVDNSSIMDSTEVYNTIFEATRNMFFEIYPESLRRVAILKSAFSEDEDTYKLPDDVEGIEYVRVGNKENNHGLQDYNLYNRDKSIVDKNFTTLEYATSYINGEQVLIIDNSLIKTHKINIGNFSDIDNISTTNITNMSIEKDDIIDTASLKFDIDKEDYIASLRLTIPEPINVTDFVTGDKSFTVNLSIPNKMIIDDIVLKISDGVNITELSTYGSLISNRFENGFNKLKFRLDKNNTVDLDSITSVEIKINYNKQNNALTDEDVTGFIIDKIDITDGEDIVISYISNAPFYNIDTQTYNQQPISDEDIIELDLDAYTILVNETGKILSAELQGEDSVFNNRMFYDILYGNGKQLGAYDKYRIKHRVTVDRNITQIYEPLTNINGKYRRILR